MKELSVVYEESNPKPTKATGTRCLEHKYSATKIALENFGASRSCFKDLAHTASGWEKRAQIKGWLNLWKEANLLVNSSVYLDILAPLEHLRFWLQAEKHDSVHVHHIQEFAWTMAKLQIVVDNTLDKGDECISYYKCFRNSLTMREVLKKAPMKLFIRGLS